MPKISNQTILDPVRPIPVLSAGLSILLVFLFAALPLGAEPLPDSGPVKALVAELSPRAAESGFADLVILKARSLPRLSDSTALISGLIPRSTKPADSRALFVELASIQELLGRYEDAAVSWEAAIAAQPGKGETFWLLSAAACSLAIGDAGTAAALAKAALLTASSPGLIARAMLIEARAMMLAGDLSGALARSREALAIQASGLEAAALSIARDASSGAEREGYAKRLREEYPGRPEANEVPVSIYSLVHFSPVPAARAGSPAVLAPGTGPASSPSVRPAERVAEAVPGPLYYQLGAFRDEANAALLSARLSRAGFKPKTVRRESRAGSLSIVYLDAGSDPSRLNIALKDAGFESWPLFAEP